MNIITFKLWPQYYIPDCHLALESPSVLDFQQFPNEKDKHVHLFIYLFIKIFI